MRPSPKTDHQYDCGQNVWSQTNTCGPVLTGYWRGNWNVWSHEEVSQISTVIVEWGGLAHFSIFKIVLFHSTESSAHQSHGDRSAPIQMCEDNESSLLGVLRPKAKKWRGFGRRLSGPDRGGPGETHLDAAWQDRVLWYGWWIPCHCARQTSHLCQRPTCASGIFRPPQRSGNSSGGPSGLCVLFEPEFLWDSWH